MIIKERCHWFNSRYSSGCGALKDLQCEANGKCSFYETEQQYKKRQAKFKEREAKAFAKAGIRGHLRSR